MDRGPNNILELPELLAELPPEEREIFGRIFHLSTATGRLEPPPAMHLWIEKNFGSVTAVREQRIVKLTNLVTGEASLFNPLRSQRPVETSAPADLQEMIEKSRGCPFCHPREGTPADSFGRIQGKYSITASNIAKYDGFHGLVIFGEHNPLLFTLEEVRDYLQTGLAWAKRAHQEDGEYKYFFFMWNCLWKAGASIVHGHAQLTLTKDPPYAKVENLRQAIQNYRSRYGREYLDDIYRLHHALGLAGEKKGVRVLAYLTPVKEKEVFILSPEWNENLGRIVYKALERFVKGLGVVSFNLAIAMPPLAADNRDWNGFPVLARVVDRGDPLNRTADVAAMELYAASVISSDPFAVAQSLNL